MLSVQDERSRAEHNLTNITKTQERVQAEKGGKCSVCILCIHIIFCHFCVYLSGNANADECVTQCTMSDVVLYGFLKKLW